MQTQAAYLKVRAEIAKYQADIAKSQADIKSAESRSVQPGVGFPMGQVGEQVPILNAPMPATVPKLSQTAPLAASKEPRLIRVTAADGRYTADIEVNGHPIFGANVGTALDGDWVVVAVDAKQVTVARGKQKRVLKV
ncbi:type IV pilus biogenesis protein PilP [Ralstonia pseudosolanacearum]|uniref:type IV pilus biogenesis protein PilP n=1 Tax=Ralstonia pseudosolanacearum TaxID=1310165 RepID=UPI00270FA515|nr:type IV pilus biogenesis protein PilP [Ralstonia pseudosolanacearum]MDO3615251.1 type IV pilus biogenesis protein PilP [Ralstonia pseudosolanacearum]